ncbi:zinc-binding dehydrogenase, partial [Asanoa sp. NPDC050611]|uniref:zinc-binding dehydrogenase n=1 Tax=Asanoa sp. NPDC050611 TaxID=3157098 RepID=UPI0033C8E093
RPSQVVDGVLLDDGGSPGSPWPAGPSRVLLDDGGAPGSPWPAGPSQVVDRVLLDDGGAPGSPWPAGPSHVVDHVLLDDGGSARPLWPGGPSHVLDLVGARTVVDSLRLVSRGGTVCVAGSLSGWLIREFEPIAMIPSGTRLTAFHSDDAKGRAGTAVLQRVVRKVEAGLYRPNIDRVFGLDDIVAAHRHMETNQAAGKVVLVTGS